MGGGPSQQQKDAASAQTNLANEQATAGRDALSFQKAQQAKIAPYATNLLAKGDPFYGTLATQGSPFWAQRETNGLPYFNQLMDYSGGTVARAFAPARADALRRTSSTAFYGMPSGYRDAVLNDVNNQQAHAYDQNIVQNLAAQEAAKQQGAEQNLQTRWNAEAANNQVRQDAARVLTGQAQLSNPQGWYGGAQQGYNSVMNAPLASPGYAGMIGGIASGALSAIPF